MYRLSKKTFSSATMKNSSESRSQFLLGAAFINHISRRIVGGWGELNAEAGNMIVINCILIETDTQFGKLQTDKFVAMCFGWKRRCKRN